MFLYFVYVLICLESISYFLYEYVLEEPFIKSSDYWVLNKKYGFYGYEYETSLDSFKIDKSNNSLRIFSFGASTTAGWPYWPEYSYTQTLENNLVKNYPNYDIEVVNCAVPGFDSREVTYQIDKALDYEPDIVIVYTSHNTISEYNTRKLKRGFLDSFFNKMGWLSSFKLFNHILNNYLSKYVTDNLLPASLKGVLFANPPLTDKDLNNINNNYKTNIDRIVDWCKSKGVKLVLLKPVYNMEQYGPGGSTVSKKTNLNKIKNKIDLGIKAYESGNYLESISIFNQCNEIDSKIAIVHFYLSKALYKINKIDEAIKLRIRSNQLDKLNLIYSEKFTPYLEKYRKSKDILYIDIFNELRKSNKNLYLTNEWIVDDLHPTLKMQNKIAELIYNKMIEKGYLKNVSKTKFVTPTISLIKKEKSEKLFYEVFQRDTPIINYWFSFTSYYPNEIINYSIDTLSLYLLNNKNDMEAEIYYYFMCKDVGKINYAKDSLFNKWGEEKVLQKVTEMNKPYKRYKFEE